MSQEEPQDTDPRKSKVGPIRILAEATEELDNFFDENKHLFTLIGVFGAVAIYLTEANLPSTKDGVIPYENFVFAGGFGLVILLSILILIKLADHVWESDKRTLQLKNVPFLGFGLLFSLLLLPLLAYVTTYERVWAAFYVIAFWLLGFMSYFGFLDLLLEKDLHKRLGNFIHISNFKAFILMIFAVLVSAFSIHLGARLVFGPEAVQMATSGIAYPNYYWLYIGLMIASIWFFMAGLTIIVKVGERACGRLRMKFDAYRRSSES